MSAYDPVFVKANGKLVTNRGYEIGSQGGLVTSVNTMTEDLVIDAGSGISISNHDGDHITITNSGVRQVSNGTGISVSAGTGNVTITNTGVVALLSGTGISLDASVGAVTVTATGPTQTTFSGFGSNTVTLSNAGGAFTQVPVNYAYQIIGGTKQLVIKGFTMSPSGGDPNISSIKNVSTFPASLATQVSGTADARGYIAGTAVLTYSGTSYVVPVFVWGTSSLSITIGFPDGVSVPSGSSLTITDFSLSYI